MLLSGLNSLKKVYSSMEVKTSAIAKATGEKADKAGLTTANLAGGGRAGIGLVGKQGPIGKRGPRGTQGPPGPRGLKGDSHGYKRRQGPSWTPWQTWTARKSRSSRRAWQEAFVG